MTERAPSALRLDHVTAAYGPFRALFGVSFDVARGEALALLGANGAGKSTAARVASGLVIPTSGRVAVGGEDLTGRREWDFARRGVGHVVEGRSVFATLTVEENLVMSLRHRVARPELRACVEAAFSRFPVLGARRRQVAGTLSGGEQRLLALAWAVVRPPELLICDELSLGLAPMVTTEIYRALTIIKNEGSAIVVVEQETRHALQLADQLVVLRNGVAAYAGSPRADAVEHILADAASGA